MNIVILGPQGSGKGTQAKLIAKKHELLYFESGDFLRKIAERNDNVQKILDEGKLVPERELASYVTAFFDEKQIYDDIIFDGYPRTIEQYSFFKEWMDERQVVFDLAIIIQVSQETTLKRLLLRKREDDTTEAIKERLRIYKEKTTPLIEELKKTSNVYEIDGERTIEAIEEDIERILNAKGNSKN